jgi:hypothetical protein
MSCRREKQRSRANIWSDCVRLLQSKRIKQVNEKLAHCAW